MVKETKYGVISDVHSDPRVVPVAIDTLKRYGAERLLVNGDIGNQQRSLQDSQNYVAFILDSIGKSGLESFVQPGSHETLLAFGPVLDHFAGQYTQFAQRWRDFPHCRWFRHCQDILVRHHTHPAKPALFQDQPGR